MRAALSAYTHCYCEENIFRLVCRLLPHARGANADAAAAAPPVPAPLAQGRLLGVYAVWLSNHVSDRDAAPAEWASAVGVRGPPERQRKGAVGKEPPVTVWDYHVWCLLHVADDDGGGSVDDDAPSAADAASAATSANASPSSSSSWWVVDYDYTPPGSRDTTATRPVPVRAYCDTTLRLTALLAPQLLHVSRHPPTLRVVHGAAFAAHFRSDRAHMLRAELRPRFVALLAAASTAEDSKPATADAAADGDAVRPAAALALLRDAGNFQATPPGEPLALAPYGEWSAARAAAHAAEFGRHVSSNVASFLNMADTEPGGAAPVAGGSGGEGGNGATTPAGPSPVVVRGAAVPRDARAWRVPDAAAPRGVTVLVLAFLQHFGGGLRAA